jgi:PAS domain-containing protein
MAVISSTQPQVQKNLLLIRVVLGLVLTAFVAFDFQTPNRHVLWLCCLEAAILLSFTPFIWLKEKQWCEVTTQYFVFFMDLTLILATLFITSHMETEFLLSFFLTIFISALSRSVTNSLLVASAISGLYFYRIMTIQPNVDWTNPILLLSFSLLFMAAIEGGYLAYRVIEEEQNLVDMARRMNVLHQQVKEGDQAALEYAGSLKNVLDSLPLGALAVSREGNIIFINQTVGKLLELNTRSLLNMSVHNGKLGPLGERMVQSLKDKTTLKREYMDIVWLGRPRRFRLDSSEGVVPGSGPWGTLFLIQDAAKPNQPEKPTSDQEQS